jgi:hypothetical protein
MRNDLVVVAGEATSDTFEGCIKVAQALKKGSRITTRDAKPQSPEVVSVCQEQLPQPVPRWDRPHFLVLQLPAVLPAFCRVSEPLNI